MMLRLREPAPIVAVVRCLAACSLLLTVAGCGGGGGGSPPAPPTGLTTVQNPYDFNGVEVSWTPPGESITAYEGQGRMGTGAWESLGEPIPAAYQGQPITGGSLELNDAVPEQTDFSFRLRSLRGSTAGPWSGEAAYHRGVRWPMNLTARPTEAGVTLAWQNPSAVATTVRIERQITGSWGVLAEVPGTQTTYTDSTGLVVDQAMLYRLIATTGEEESLSSATASATYPESAAHDVIATVEGTQVRLRWSNPPVPIDSVRIHRADDLNAAYFSNPVAELPAGATEYLDSPPAGGHVYYVQVVYPGSHLGPPSGGVQVMTPPEGLAVALVTYPDAQAVARDSQGRLAFAHGGSFYPPATGTMSVSFSGAGAAPDHDLGTANAWVAPSVAFDPQDHPHILLVRAIPGNDARQRLVHVWYDGASWSEEVVTDSVFDPNSVRFTIDGAGGVHTTWSTVTPAPVAGYARRDAGGWVVEDLTALLPAGEPLLGLAVDGAGVPGILARTTTYGLVLLRRQSAWASEAVPDAPVATGGLYRGPTGLGLIELRCDSAGGYVAHLVATERTAAGWGAVSSLADFAVCIPIDSVGAMTSADGSRTVVVLGMSFNSTLYLEQSGQPWTTLPLGFPIGAGITWFDGADRLRALFRTNVYAAYDGTGLYALYQQP